MDGKILTICIKFVLGVFLSYFITLIIIRLLTVYFSWKLNKKYNIKFKIGGVGLLCLKEVFLQLEKDITLEIENIWLSSGLLHSDYRTFLVLCISDFRLQGNILEWIRSKRTKTTDQSNEAKKIKFPSILKKISLHVKNTNVMQIGSVGRVCMLHVTVHELSILFATDNNIGKIHTSFLSTTIKIFSHISKLPSSDSCLAQLSFNLEQSIHLDLNGNHPLIQKTSVYVNQPEIIFYESLSINIIHALLFPRVQTNEDEIKTYGNFSEVSSHSKEINFSKIPLEVEIKVRTFTIKLMREGGKRILSIDLKSVESNVQREREFNELTASALFSIQDLTVSSIQTQFVLLNKILLSAEINSNIVNVNTSLSCFNLHYQHEEFNYWLGLIPLSQSVSKKSENVISVKRSRFSYDILRGYKYIYKMEVENINLSVKLPSCYPIGCGVNHGRVTVEYDLCSLDDDRNISTDGIGILNSELLLEASWCRIGEAREILNEEIFNDHVWNSPFTLGLLIVKVWNDSASTFSLQCKMERTKLEWSPTLSKNIQEISLYFKKSSSCSDNKIIPGKKEKNSSAIHFSNIELKLNSTDIFAISNAGTVLAFRIDYFSVEKSILKMQFELDGLKVQHFIQPKKPFQCLKSSEIKNCVLNFRTVKFDYEDKETKVQLLKIIQINWSTTVHMTIFNITEEMKNFKTKLIGNTISKSKSNEKMLNLSIKIYGEMLLEAKLSKIHRLVISSNDLSIAFLHNRSSFQAENLNICFNDYDIFIFKHLNLISFDAEEPNVISRENFGKLELQKNKAWNLHIDEGKATFPYQYKFAEACSEQAVSIIKWLKLIHKREKKAFTLSSPLPADVSIKIKAFSMEIEDDPFEVKLRDNFELLEDEYHESLKRRRILDEKIERLIKRKLLLPAAKLEELYETFAKKNAEIYIKRSQQLYQYTKKRTDLLLWKLDEIDIMFVADLSYHGKERVFTSMKEIDDSSPFPEEEIEFCTLWCRMIQANISSITVTLRDFPQALIELRKLHIWGKLIGAEQEGSYRAKRKSIVEIDEPWSNVDIERNMGFLKFYHDLTWDMESLGMAYGVCWEPVIAQVVIAMENISKPSADPSPALPWWDKIRLLYHGRNTFFFQNLTFLLHASLDPYNTMEQMEIAWSDVIIEWTNAKIVTKGDLDIYVHTASKYDDCRLLHMPKLKLQFKLDWQCLGHPNEHFSVIPCAQDKVPEYSSNQTHDSYRAFRSENLNMIISLETKPVALETAADIPTMLLYSSTLRWIENLKIIHAGVTRLTRRGKLFSNTKPRKTPLGRHYRHIRLSLNLHKFQVCYWMSFAKQRGLELLGGRLSLSSEHVLSLIPIEDNLTHRPAVNWNISHLTCELGDSEIWLYNILNDKNNDENKSLMFPVERSYFLSVTRVSYGREAPIRDIKTEEDDIPTHRLVVHGLKGAWTKHNRDVIFNLFDSYMKAKILKRNLSTEALKGIKVDPQPCNMKHRTYTTTNLCLPNCQQPTSPMSHLQSGLAANMLQKLIAEAEANTMVYTEEIDCPNREQQLHGIAACQTDDVLHKNWLIELVNSQVMLKGSETSGYVIVSAAKSQILQRVHRPVWKDHTLVSKTTWVGSLECMQYYATVDAGEPGPSVDNIMWLSLDNIEERASMVISDLPDLVGSGHSVGGVVSSTVGGTSDPTTAPLQLQRIVSRCGCQFFYASYGENIDSGSVEVPPLPEDNDLWVRENAVDSFTLTHHDLDMCTNSLQYAMLLDLVNNLLLYVEPRKKEASEKLQRMRFQLELRSIDDLKAPILQLQNQVRSHVFNVRQLEREAYIIHRALNDNPDREDLIRELEQLEREVSEQKEQLTASSEELAMMISCFKEKQVRATKTRQRAAAPGQGILVVRRSEVCFKHARWRLTDADGQLGIADLVLNNFLYSKVTKSDDSVEHLLELGYVKMTNLLPNSHYKIVLQPTELQPNIPLDRQRALRIFCRERAPVGGIPVKEHLELNMIPITIGLTYAFVTTMLKFFFPGRNTEDHHGDDEQEGTLTRSKKRPMSHKHPSTSTNSRDDIEKMKERAEKNHTFLYIKIPEVPIKISYKGEKEKNIEDLHECGLVLPTLEYHDCTWTWLDLLMEMKNATKRVLVSQAIKQKLLKPSRPGTDETSQPQEEDKVRLLFGPKVIGNTEKSSKKSLLAKLQK